MEHLSPDTPHRKANRKYYAKNKDERSAYQKTYSVEQREAWLLTKKKSNFKRRYGITLSDFEKMLNNQEGRCKICGEENLDLVVDHNHETGEVRGLLCRICNMLLGCAKDSPDILFSAAKYLMEAK